MKRIEDNNLSTISGGNWIEYGILYIDIIDRAITVGPFVGQTIYDSTHPDPLGQMIYTCEDFGKVTTPDDYGFYCS